MPLGTPQASKATQAFSNTVTTDALAASSTTGSTFLIYGIQANTTAVLTVGDNKGNTYSALGTSATNTNDVSKIFICQNGTGGAGHTANINSDQTQWIGGFLVELPGTAASSLDQSVDWTADAASPFTSGTTGTTSQANEIVITCLLDDDFTALETYTWGNSFTELIKDNRNGAMGNFAIAYRIVSSTGTYQSSETTSGAPSNVYQLIATFKEAGAGGGNVLMGQVCT